MTPLELYEDWCRRIDITTKTVIERCKAGDVTVEWQAGFCEAVEVSMDTIHDIIEEMN